MSTKVISTNPTQITLTNDFHNTEAVVRSSPSQHGVGSLTADQLRRAVRKLCGISDCMCGGVRGGDYYVDPEQWSSDGSVLTYVIHRRTSA